MARRRPRRDLLSLHASRFANSFSCLYCDYKVYAFNERVYSFGCRHARFLKVWFSIGVGCSFVAFIGVTVVLLWEFWKAVYSHGGTSWIDKRSIGWLFGPPNLPAGLSMSLIDTGILVFSTSLSVVTHEFGHAAAAARSLSLSLYYIIVDLKLDNVIFCKSELELIAAYDALKLQMLTIVLYSDGLQIEYVAIFLAILFPGALVAFNYSLLQILPQFAALRMYCAGIWHNIVLCAVCGLTILVLPGLLCPFYLHDKGPIVLGVPEASPLFGVLSRGDVIVSVDGSNISNPYEWISKMDQANVEKLDKHPSVQDRQGSLPLCDGKGYCVPISWLEGINGNLPVDDQFSCPDEQALFRSMPCCNSSIAGGSSEDSDKKGSENKSCLTAKDVVKLKKCGEGWKIANKIGCSCSKDESCMAPVQVPGTSWVEISFLKPYSSDCMHQREGLRGAYSLNQEYGFVPCGGTFVFVGDLSVAYSVQLSAYRPRWNFAILSLHMPTLLEKIFLFTFHVSATLALINSLPVFFLDGESILEICLSYMTWLNLRRRQNVLRTCLVAGSFACLVVSLRILYITLMTHE